MFGSYSWGSVTAHESADAATWTNAWTNILWTTAPVMATVVMHGSSFNEIIEENKLVIIDFWAEWCGPCRAYAPVFEGVSEEFPDVVFAKVDTEVEQELAGSFGIRSIPTTVAFRDGIGVFMQPGALPEDALRDLIGKLQSLDMDEVRAELDAQDAQESS